MNAIRLTSAQITALDTAGLWEGDDDTAPALVEAIVGSTLTLTPGNREAVAREICILSNGADELARTLTGEAAQWARADSRALANLYGKALRA